MAFEPIEPQLKTVRSANRRQYSVSSFGTAAFSSPPQATGVTVNLGGRNIPQDDPIYPWTFDADGDVVFTRNTPSTNELVTITVDPTQQFLDFTKVKFPSGYSLDARVLNRTFLDALYTANILWTLGDDSITAWGESENVPIPTADDHFLITESAGWKSKSLITAQNILDIQTGDNLDLTNLKANSVSSTTLSAVDFQASSLSSTNIHLEDYEENLVNIRRLKFDTDIDNPTCFIGTEDGSSLLVDVSSSIRFNPFLTSPALYSEMSPSGYLSYRAVNQKDSQTNPSYLDNYVSDNTNIITDLRFTQESGGGTPYENSWAGQSIFAQAQGTVKAENIPVLGIRVENSFSLNISDYANFAEAVENITPIKPQSQTLIRTGSPVNAYTECFPYIGLARVIGLNAPTTQQAPYEFNPGLFLNFRKNQSFDYPFFRDLESTDNPNDFDKFIFNGVGRFKVSGRNDSFFPLHGRIHFLGSPRYRELALQYNGTVLAIGGNDIPVENGTPATFISPSDFGCAIIEMFKDPILNTASFDIGSTETCTISLEGVLYLKGDTYYP